ncbi:N-alpha-acetyltransferase, non-catalitic subunit [Savitreella phatthalungensis]
MEQQMASLDLTDSGNNGSSTERWTDITAEYFAACSTLTLGQLVRKEEFSLHDSIAALEIMDPKMDNGVVTEEEAAMGTLDVSRARTCSEVLMIADQLFRKEMAWHSGSHLSQTLFTCVYLQKLLTPSLQPDGKRFSTDSQTQNTRLLLDHVLYPLIAATVKCCAYVRETFASGYLYEEEDVSSQDYGLPLLGSASAFQVVQLLQRGADVVEGLKVNSKEEELPVLAELALRLQGRSSLLMALDYPQGSSEATSHWRDVQTSFKSWRQLDAGSLEDDALVFNTSFQRVLDSTTPPRPILDVSFKEAQEQMCSLAEDMAAIGLIKGAEASVSPTALLAHFEAFRVRQPARMPFARLEMQLAFLHDKSAEHGEERAAFCRASIQECVGACDVLFGDKVTAAEAPSDVRYQAMQVLSACLTMVEGLLLDLYKILCHNPGRVRRNLAKLLMDADALIADTEAADQRILDLVAQSPLANACGVPETQMHLISTWLRHLEMTMSVTLVKQAAELDLLKPFELLAHFFQLDTILFLQNDVLYQIFSVQLNASREYRARSPAAAAWISSTMLRNEVESIVCKGMLFELSALSTLGVIAEPAGVGLGVADRAKLYEYRIKIFRRCARHRVSSPAAFFPDYATCMAEIATMTGLNSDPTSPADRVRSARENLGKAKDMFDLGLKKLSEMKIALSKIRARRGLDSEGPLMSAVDKAEDARSRSLAGCCVSSKLAINNLLTNLPPDTDPQHILGRWKSKGKLTRDTRYDRTYATLNVVFVD